MFPRSPTDVLLIASVLWFGSGAGGYLLTIGIGKPLYSYIALIILGLFCFVAQATAHRTPAILRNRWLRKFVLWLLVYLVYGAVTFLESSQSEIAVQAVITLFELTLMAGAFAVLLVHPRRMDQAISAFALLALAAAGLNLFDFIVPTFSVVPGRGAGLYGNPNTSGCVVAMAMLCGIESVPKRLRLAFVLACGVGVVVTFSRSSWILWGIGLAWLGWHRSAGSPRRRLILTASSAFLGIGFLLAIFSGELGELLVRTSILDYLDPNTLGRLGVGASSLSGYASESRLDAALYALQVFPSTPLLGHGIGYVYEWGFPVGPHNMYLRFLVEGGLVGLLLYLSLMRLLWGTSSGLLRVLAIQTVIAGFFSHNMLEQPSIVLIMVFLLARGALERREQYAEAGAPQALARA